MKSVSTTVLGFALAIAGATTFGTGSVAAKKEEAKPAAPHLSKPVRDALVAAQAALTAGDVAGADAKLAVAAAAATTVEDRFFTSQLQYEAALKANDADRQGAAIDAMIASGGATPDLLPKLYQNQGALAYKANNFVKAEEMFGHYAELSANNPDAYVILAEMQFRNKHFAAGFASSEKAIALKKAAGAPVDENWYRRSLGVAYENKLTADAAKWSLIYVEAYGTPENWRTALSLFRDGVKLDPQQELDVFRLQRAANALKGERDYYEYANSAFERGLPGEARQVLDDAVAAKMVDGKNVAINEVRTLAGGKIAADKAALPGLDTRARAAPDARSALATANAWIGYGEYAKAADLLRVGLQKPGVDADTANTRLGIALAMSGQKAEALQAFAAVTGGTRATIARYWTAWLNQKA